MIGIIGAMDEEIELLLQSMKDKRKETVAGSDFYQGTIHGKKVVLLKSGIGKVNASMSTTIMMERYAPKMIINTGSAGGFSEHLNVGDLVISEEVVHHDVDVTAFNYQLGQVPGLPETFKANRNLLELTKKIISKMQVGYEIGLIATGDSFMEDSIKVAQARKNFPEMIASEMEAAAIAQVCHQYNTPFVIIRALSDIAGKESSISFDAFLKTAAKNAAELIMQVIKNLD